MSRPWLLALLAASLAVGAQACRDGKPDPDISGKPQTISTEELGRIGGRIYNEPDRAGEILQKVGLSPDQFEERVRAVTNDPAQAREYTRGFEVVARPARTTGNAGDSMGAEPLPDSSAASGLPPSP